MKVALSRNLPNFALALGITLLLGACAGQPPIPATAEEAVAALETDAVAARNSENVAEGEEELICRSEVRTGTNFRTRVCRTAAEWNARSRGQRSYVEERANNERGQAGVDSANSAAGTNAVGL